MTSETVTKLKMVYSNLKNFYIINVSEFVNSLGVDLTKKTGIYLANTELQKLILSQAKLKKNVGIIYISDNLTEKLYYTLKRRFANEDDIGKIVLIDNGSVPKHQDLYNIFDEVIFFERFQKNKIIECNGFEKSPQDQTITSLIMDEIKDKIK